jgi:cell division protein FtsB
MASDRRRRPSRRPRARAPSRRWLAAGVLAVVAFLYVQPLRAYLDTRGTLDSRAHEVSTLEAKRKSLERLLDAQASDAALLREARRLGYVKPGEQLFIVKGIPAWRHARAKKSEG